MAQLPSVITHVVLYTMKEGVPETWVQNPSHGILVVTLWEHKFPSYYWRGYGLLSTSWPPMLCSICLPTAVD